MDRMASHPYASTKLKTRKKAAAKNAVARTAQAMQKLDLPTMMPVAAPTGMLATSSSPELLACISQAKHQRLIEMLRDLRAGAEALSANADNLLSRLS